MEAPIVAGLKRPGDPAADAGARGDLTGAVPRLANLGGAVADAAHTWYGRTTDWAIKRALAPNSLTGISVLFALCAAAWFSGGTGADNIRGALAVCGWCLARAGARQLAGTAGQAGGPRSAVSSTLTGSTDWLVLPGADWDDGADQGPAQPAVAVTAPHERSGDQFSGSGVRGSGGDESGAGSAEVRDVGWLVAVCTVTAECAVYGGIAAGGQAAGWTGMWPLAVMALVAVAFREAIGVCSRPVAPARKALARDGAVGPGGAAGPGSAIERVVTIGRRAGRTLAPPAGVRVLLAVVVLAVHGPREALFAVLAIEVISICLAIAGIRAVARPGSVAAIRDPHPGLFALGRQHAAASATGRPDAASATGPTRQAVVLASRDDGPLVRWAGRLVQGNLIPLPPALAGLAAIVMLAALGIGNLPGVLVLAPLSAMLLAAPGASHPHDGRFDWLVPVVLLTGQYIYLATVGFARGVPGPVVYLLCALTAVWYSSRVAGLAGAPGAPRRTREGSHLLAAHSGQGIGWEGRMFVVGIGATLGISTLSYLALAAYLGVLMCRKVVIGYLIPREEEHR